MTRDERLNRLSRQVQAMIENQVAFSERLTELEIRSRFALSVIKLAKKPEPGSIIDVDLNGVPKLNIMDGWTAYSTGGRENMLDILEREFLAPKFTAQALEIKHAGDPRQVEGIIDALIDEYRLERDGADDEDEGDPPTEGDAETGDSSETRH